MEPHSSLLMSHIRKGKCKVTPLVPQSHEIIWLDLSWPGLDLRWPGRSACPHKYFHSSVKHPLWGHAVTSRLTSHRKPPDNQLNRHLAASRELNMHVIGITITLSNRGKPQRGWLRPRCRSEEHTHTRAGTVARPTGGATTHVNDVVCLRVGAQM